MTPAGQAARQDALLAATGILTTFSNEFSASQLKTLLPLLQQIRQFLDEQRYLP